MPARVAVARNCAYTSESVHAAVRELRARLDPPLPDLVRPGMRVFVKVNLGCGGLRRPEERYSSHPLMVEAVIRALQECGAEVRFGDDVSRVRRPETLWSSTGMVEVARHTGAALVDLLLEGGREVPTHLLYPRTHFIANAILDADLVVNLANCRSLTPVVMSGAVKNMFGCVVGPERRSRMHAIFPERRRLARVLVDVHRVIRPAVSILDMTSVIEGQAAGPRIRQVGLILASTDAVALDTVAARVIGYEAETIWTTVRGQAVGLGTADPGQIHLRGLTWEELPRLRLRLPANPRVVRESAYRKARRILRHTVFRARPKVDPAACSGCGDCIPRCPTQAMELTGSTAVLHSDRCANCGACVEVCPDLAVRFHDPALIKMAQGVRLRLRNGVEGRL